MSPDSPGAPPWPRPAWYACIIACTCPPLRRWWIGCWPEGGFLANPTAPVPDLLSTATVLYALHRLRYPLDPARRNACLRFIESVMAESGGFCGHGMDDTPDCEYTFYALLALGCLAEGSVAR